MNITRRNITGQRAVPCLCEGSDSDADTDTDINTDEMPVKRKKHRLCPTFDPTPFITTYRSDKSSESVQEITISIISKQQILLQK